MSASNPVSRHGETETRRPQKGQQDSMQDHDLHGAGRVGQLEGDRADHGLRQRRREQCASQSARLQSRDDRADESDREHPDVQQVGGIVVFNPDEAGSNVEQAIRNAAVNARPAAIRYAVLLGSGIGSPLLG